MKENLNNKISKVEFCDPCVTKLSGISIENPCVYENPSLISQDDLFCTCLDATDKRAGGDNCKFLFGFTAEKIVEGFDALCYLFNNWVYPENKHTLAPFQDYSHIKVVDKNITTDKVELSYSRRKSVMW